MIRSALLFLFFQSALFAQVQLGVDILFEKESYQALLEKKKIGLITNQSAVNGKFQTTFELLKSHQKDYELVALFAPEHGFYGDAYAYEEINDHSIEGIPVYALYGKHRRPTPDMLADIDLLVYDIQDVGSRTYSYISTLFYCMEEAAKHNIAFIVLDRPNPMGGNIVDGPLVEEEWRSFLGYVNVPYCHGMTSGELALLFNREYNVGCDLKIIPMKGWKRGMTFAQTGLPWIPTSPQIPEADTPFFYSTTGLIGHLSITNIGIGYTLPFKIIGAPWIKAEELANALNEQHLPGVHFQSCYFRPFFGKFKLENCQGVRILIQDAAQFLPMTTQFTLIGVLKNLYPVQYKESIQLLNESNNKKDVFNKLNGGEKILSILLNERYVIWKLREICTQAKEAFMPVRAKYLLYS
ncbi:MAG: DUF1343 domain-containing protein [Chlamydiales bacterium]